MGTDLSRRIVLRRVTAGLAATALPFRSAFAASVQDDDAYWTQIAAQYDVTDEIIQLENGNWGMMARPVLDTYKAQVERVNRDYDSMQASMDAAMAGRGAQIVRIALPEPATHANVLAAYEAAFNTHPNLRLVLLTHVSHRTGLQIPVREIVHMARERGIDAIVDAAHSLGQVDFTLPDLKADFVGLNLHKWIGAPLGVGAAYIRGAGSLQSIPTSPTRTDRRAPSPHASTPAP